MVISDSVQWLGISGTVSYLDTTDSVRYLVCLTECDALMSDSDARMSDSVLLKYVCMMLEYV